MGEQNGIKEMFHYASVSIGVGLGDKLKANIFPLIVGVLATPVAVTLLDSLPTRLLRFPIDGVSTMTENSLILHRATWKHARIMTTCAGSWF